MSKNPTNVSFSQGPDKGQGGTTTAKNKGQVGFQQNPHKGAAGKTSAKKNPTKVPFNEGMKGSMKAATTKKNPGTMPFDQPRKQGPQLTKLQAEAKNVGKGAKTKTAGNVAPPIKSVDDITAFRKKKYGV